MAQAGQREYRSSGQESYMGGMIESQTGKVPTDLFLWAAGGSILGSLMYQIRGEREKSLFVGQWAPTFLILGLHGKLNKIINATEERHPIM